MKGTTYPNIHIRLQKQMIWYGDKVMIQCGHTTYSQCKMLFYDPSEGSFKAIHKWPQWKPIETVVLSSPQVILMANYWPNGS